MTIKCPQCDIKNPDDTFYCGKCATPLKSPEQISVTKTLKRSTRGLPKGIVISKKYKIIEKLGEGGMGIVYKAKDARLDRTVALKFLSLDLIRDKDTKKRFMQEEKQPLL